MTDVKLNLVKRENNSVFNTLLVIFLSCVITYKCENLRVINNKRLVVSLKVSIIIACITIICRLR